MSPPNMQRPAFVAAAPVAAASRAALVGARVCGSPAPTAAPAPCRRARTARMQAGNGDAEDKTDDAPAEAGRETTLDLETEVLDESSGAVRLRPSPNLALGLLTLGGACLYAGDGFAIAGFPAALLGTLLLFQTYNAVFFFGPTRLTAAVRVPPLVGDVKLLRGWQYARMSNWVVWWPAFPVLGYFNECESYDGRGSVHFLPIIFDGRQFIDLLRERTPHLDQTLRADQDKSGS